MVMDIRANLHEVKKSLPADVTLVAVSKTHPVDTILEAHSAGQFIFGENKVQEMVAKQEVLPNNIQWHMIGHLQSNKVKFIAPYVSLIHSVDSLKLLEVINREALKAGRVIDCLLQVFIAEEETKFGLSDDEIYALLESGAQNNLKNVRIVGLMGMASFSDNMEQVRSEFRHLNATFNDIKQKFFADSPSFKEISMGMSSDYMVAVEEGSTMVRLGSTIFGQRNYRK